jgi:transcriptional regulator of acetoin/glycerol metabolism
VRISHRSTTSGTLIFDRTGYENGAFFRRPKKRQHGQDSSGEWRHPFLDELGDMLLSLQARLLRVLQERMVTPLGSTRAIPVNVELICATNGNLRELIASGGIREGLYYRLNGLVVGCPRCANGPT